MEEKRPVDRVRDDAARPVNDRSEGILRDPVNYKGEIVSYVKDIGNGDPGYDANVRKVLIMKQDGTEHVVPEADILKQPETVVQQSAAPDRRPDQMLPPANPGISEGDLHENPQSRPPVGEGGAPNRVPEGNKRASEKAEADAKAQAKAHPPRGTGGQKR